MTERYETFCNSLYLSNMVELMRLFAEMVIEYAKHIKSSSSIKLLPKTNIFAELIIMIADI